MNFHGDQKYLNEFLKTHVEHLLGNYDEALVSYKKLYDEMEIMKEAVPTHVFHTITIKYIDLLFLKGKFKTSLKMIDDMLDSPKISLSEKLELYRTKGHIYRFNLMFDEAEKIYQHAYKLIEKYPSKAFEGKIYTNLAEAMCMKNPSKALEFVEKSIEINTQLENKIELGKTYAASCVAKAMLKDFDNAIIDGSKGKEIQEMVGYQSGKLFCDVSLLLTNYLKNEGQTIKELNDEINDTVKKIKVYTFLEKYVNILIDGNEDELLNNNDFEWIDIQKTVDNIKSVKTTYNK